MPETTCTACGEPLPADAKACPGCGAMAGTPSSGFSLDAEPEPDVGRPAPPPPPPPPVPEPEPEPEPEPTPEPVPEPGAPSDKTVAEKAAEKEEPKGETVRMSLADATQAWMEDAPTTTAVLDDVDVDLEPPKTRRTALLVVLGLAVAALIALALLL